MKVSCPACDSQYTIADEKVSGRKVKVRCKSCGGQILVDGTAQTASAEAAGGAVDEENDATRVFSGAERSAFDAEHAQVEVSADAEPTSSTSNGEIMWSVNVSETDERSLTTAQVIDGYLSGEFAGEVFVWREGMGDWSLIANVPELKQAIEAKGGPKSRPLGSSPVAAAPGSRPASAKPNPTAKSVTSPGSTQPKKTLTGAAAKTATAAKPAATAGLGTTSTGKATGTAGVATAAADKKTAARVTNAKRPQSAHDLFAAASQPSEDVDVSLSQEDEQKPTGARNESSVLFSLDALKAGIVSSPQAVAASKGPPGRKGPPTAPKKKLEDLMSGAAANAPLITNAGPSPLMMSSNQALLTAPAPPPPKPAPKPVEPEIQAAKAPVQATAVVPSTPTAEKKNKKGLLIGAAVAAIAVIAGIAVAVTGGGDKDKASAEASASAAPSVAVAVEPKPEPPKPAEPPPAETKPAEPVASASAAPTTAPVAVATGPSTPTTTKTATGDTKKATDTKKDAKKDEPSTPTPAAAGAFSKDAAIQALNVAASQASSCKKPDGPTGTGKVQVTFAPSGRATTAVIVGGSFGGTPVGGCVSNVFKRARVPAFSGDPVTVSKSFSIIP
jgi:predicted Zn finger-like uncharacterized protein